MLQGPGVQTHTSAGGSARETLTRVVTTATRALSDRVSLFTCFIVGRELSIVLGAYFLYSASRNLIHPGTVEQAFANAVALVQLERVLGVFFELEVQRWFLLNFETGLQLLTYLYTYGFWVVLLGSAVLLFVLHRELYYKMRQVFLITLCIGLVVFALFPLAPPRFFPQLGFVDAMRFFGIPILSGGESLITYNKFAAMPSLHYTWALLLAEAWRRYGNRTLAWAAVAFQILILIAIVATANHYVLDAVLAVAVIIAALRLRDRLQRFFSASTNIGLSISPNSEARLLADRSNLCAVLRNSGASGAFTGAW